MSNDVKTIPFSLHDNEAPDSCCHVLSPHEQKLADDSAGRKGYRVGRERIYNILDGVSGVIPKIDVQRGKYFTESMSCLLYTSPSPRDRQKARMPSSA